MRSGKVSPDDFAGTTCTITNPGMIGTVHSVPRLMPGQGFIVGVGSIGYPAEFEGADPAALAQLGVSKVTTLTNTYDHRIIGGAESGEFLRRIHELLLGGDDFYDDMFPSLAVPYEPARWNADRSALGDPASQQEKVVQVHALVNMYRVRGHLIANLDPLGRRPRARTPSSTSRTTTSRSGTSTASSRSGASARAASPQQVMPLRDILGVLRDAYAAHGRRRVHAHPGAGPEGMDPAAGRSAARAGHLAREAPDPRAPQRRRGLRALPPHQVPGPEALQPRGRGDASSRCSTRSAARPPTPA